MALDIAQTLHDQIWTLLEADTGFTAAVKAGNREKQTDSEYPTRADLKRQASDYPKCIVRVTASALNKPDGQVVKIFGHNAANFTSSTADHGVPGSATISIKIIHDKMKLTLQSPLESYVHRAIFSKGPRLGLNTWVSGFTIDCKRADRRNDETGQVLRTVAEFILAITLRPKLSQITGA